MRSAGRNDRAARRRSQDDALGARPSTRRGAAEREAVHGEPLERRRRAASSRRRAPRSRGWPCPAATAAGTTSGARRAPCGAATSAAISHDGDAHDDDRDEQRRATYPRAASIRSAADRATSSAGRTAPSSTWRSRRGTSRRRAGQVATEVGRVDAAAGEVGRVENVGCRGGVVERDLARPIRRRAAARGRRGGRCAPGRADSTRATSAQSSRPVSTIAACTTREGGLEPDHAVRGGVPLALLRLDRVRRVVGGDDVDRAVGEAPRAAPRTSSSRRSGGFTLKRAS